MNISEQSITTLVLGYFRNDLIGQVFANRFFWKAKLAKHPIFQGNSKKTDLGSKHLTNRSFGNSKYVWQVMHK